VRADHLAARVVAEGIDGDRQSDIAAQFGPFPGSHLLKGVAQDAKLLVIEAQ
jgi:hypothetical protein